MSYWIFSGGNVTGPFTLDDLKSNKDLSRYTLISHSNAEGASANEWKLASTIDELKPLFTKPSYKRSSNGSSKTERTSKIDFKSKYNKFKKFASNAIKNRGSSKTAEIEVEEFETVGEASQPIELTPVQPLPEPEVSASVEPASDEDTFIAVKPEEVELAEVMLEKDNIEIKQEDNNREITPAQPSETVNIKQPNAKTNGKVLNAPNFIGEAVFPYVAKLKRNDAYLRYVLEEEARLRETPAEETVNISSIADAKAMPVQEPGADASSPAYDKGIVKDIMPEGVNVHGLEHEDVVTLGETMYGEGFEPSDVKYDRIDDFIDKELLNMSRSHEQEAQDFSQQHGPVQETLPAGQEKAPEDKAAEPEQEDKTVQPEQETKEEPAAQEQPVQQEEIVKEPAVITNANSEITETQTGDSQKEDAHIPDDGHIDLLADRADLAHGAGDTQYIEVGASTKPLKEEPFTAEEADEDEPETEPVAAEQQPEEKTAGQASPTEEGPAEQETKAAVKDSSVERLKEGILKIIYKKAPKKTKALITIDKELEDDSASETAALQEKKPIIASVEQPAVTAQGKKDENAQVSSDPELFKAYTPPKKPISSTTPFAVNNAQFNVDPSDTAKHVNQPADYDEISSSSIESSGFDSSSTTASDLDASAFDASDLSASSVDSSKLDSSALDASNLNTSAVDAADVFASAIDANDLNASQVDANDVNASAIDSMALEAASLDASAVDASALDASSFDLASVDASDLHASAIDAADLHAASVDASELNASALEAHQFDVSALDASDFSADDFDFAQVHDDSISPFHVNVINKFIVEDSRKGKKYYCEDDEDDAYERRPAKETPPAPEKPAPIDININIEFLIGNELKIKTTQTYDADGNLRASEAKPAEVINSSGGAVKGVPPINLILSGLQEGGSFVPKSVSLEKSKIDLFPESSETLPVNEEPAAESVAPVQPGEPVSDDQRIAEEFNEPVSNEGVSLEENTETFVLDQTPHIVSASGDYITDSVSMEGGETARQLSEQVLHSQDGQSGNAETVNNGETANNEGQSSGQQPQFANESEGGIQTANAYDAGQEQQTQQTQPSENEVYIEQPQTEQFEEVQPAAISQQGSDEPPPAEQQIEQEVSAEPAAQEQPQYDTQVSDSENEELRPDNAQPQTEEVSQEEVFANPDAQTEEQQPSCYTALTEGETVQGPISQEVFEYAQAAVNAVNEAQTFTEKQDTAAETPEAVSQEFTAENTQSREALQPEETAKPEEFVQENEPVQEQFYTEEPLTQEQAAPQEEAVAHEEQQEPISAEAAEKAQPEEPAYGQNQEVQPEHLEEIKAEELSSEQPVQETETYSQPGQTVEQHNGAINNEHEQNNNFEEQPVQTEQPHQEDNGEIVTDEPENTIEHNETNYQEAQAAGENFEHPSDEQNKDEGRHNYETVSDQPLTQENGQHEDEPQQVSGNEFEHDTQPQFDVQGDQASAEIPENGEPVSQAAERSEETNGFEQYQDNSADNTSGHTENNQHEEEQVLSEISAENTEVPNNNAEETQSEETLTDSEPQPEHVSTEDSLQDQNAETYSSRFNVEEVKDETQTDAQISEATAETVQENQPAEFAQEEPLDENPKHYVDEPSQAAAEQAHENYYEHAPSDEAETPLYQENENAANTEHQPEETQTEEQSEPEQITEENNLESVAAQNAEHSENEPYIETYEEQPLDQQDFTAQTQPQAEEPFKVMAETHGSFDAPASSQEYAEQNGEREETSVAGNTEDANQTASEQQDTEEQSYIETPVSAQLEGQQSEFADKQEESIENLAQEAQHETSGQEHFEQEPSDGTQEQENISSEESQTADENNYRPNENNIDPQTEDLRLAVTEQGDSPLIENTENRQHEAVQQYNQDAPPTGEEQPSVEHLSEVQPEELGHEQPAAPENEISNQPEQLQEPEFANQSEEGIQTSGAYDAQQGLQSNQLLPDAGETNNQAALQEETSAAADENQPSAQEPDIQTNSSEPNFNFETLPQESAVKEFQSRDDQLLRQHMEHLMEEGHIEGAKPGQEQPQEPGEFKMHHINSADGMNAVPVIMDIDGSTSSEPSIEELQTGSDEDTGDMDLPAISELTNAVTVTQPVLNTGQQPVEPMQQAAPQAYVQPQQPAYEQQPQQPVFITDQYHQPRADFQIGPQPGEQVVDFPSAAPDSGVQHPGPYQTPPPSSFTTFDQSRYVTQVFPQAYEPKSTEFIAKSVGHAHLTMKNTGTRGQQPKVNKKKAVFIIFALIVVFILMVLMFATMFGNKKQPIKNTPANNSRTSNGNSSAAGNTTPAAASDIAVPLEELVKSNDTLAIEIVQNHPLDAGRGTLGEWFAQTYKNSGGKEEWYSRRLFQENFVVHYKLLKPRTDAIVYMFEVNLKDKKITRGINNLAIQLLAPKEAPAPAPVAPPPPAQPQAPARLPLPPEPTGR